MENYFLKTKKLSCIVLKMTKFCNWKDEKQGTGDIQLNYIYKISSYQLRTTVGKDYQIIGV